MRAASWFFVSLAVSIAESLESEFNHLTFSLRKPAAFLVADAARELDGFGKIHPHFLRRVGVRAKRNRHAFLKREFENLAARVDFPAILSQPGGVQFDGAIMFFGRIQEFFVKRGAIRRRAMPELFRQVHVADDFKKTGFRGLVSRSK